jgi:hypothetical protein
VKNAQMIINTVTGNNLRNEVFMDVALKGEKISNGKKVSARFNPDFSPVFYYGRQSARNSRLFSLQSP